MSWLYRTILRPALFAQDSEQIHRRTMERLAWASRHEVICDLLESFFSAPPLSVEAFGLKFSNPVGLAAGMDKSAEAVPVWAALGFGFSELGGVTFHPQPGNPAPRIFRAVADQALVNRMGFNNPGAEAMARKLSEWRALGRWPKHPVGINLGKSKVTSLENAAQDYASSFRLLRPYADFFVVNVSSPNTPNLRKLQDKAALDEILRAIQEVQASGGLSLSGGAPERGLQSASAPELPGPAGTVTGPLLESGVKQAEACAPGLPLQSHRAAELSLFRKPILVKVAPDLSFEALDEILELVGPRQIAGLIATNTTLARPKTDDAGLQRVYAEAGGLSGRPLAKRSTEIIRHLYRQTRGTLPIIGVGGIFSVEDAWEKLQAGACLLQIYTGLIYEGPTLVKELITGLSSRLNEIGLREFRQAVGKHQSSVVTNR